MSGLRPLARRLAYEVLGSAPRIRRRLAAIERGGKATILNLHRVSDDESSGYKPLRPRLFEELLDFLQANFAVVRLDDLGGRSSRPKVALSFDDGYRDFVEVVAPILARRRLAANLNIVPTCIEKQLPPFNVLAQDYLGKAPAELVERLEVPGFGAMKGAGLAMRLSAFLKNRPREEQASLEELLVPQFLSWEEFRPTPMMTLDETRQVSGDHDLGGHGWAHATMGYETEPYFRDDLAQCGRYFQDRIGQPMAIYAFPNGSYTQRQLEIGREFGIRHLLLVDEDFSDSDHVHNRFTFGAQTVAEMRFRAAGGMKAIA